MMSVRQSTSHIHDHPRDWTVGAAAAAKCGKDPVHMGGWVGRSNMDIIKMSCLLPASCY